MAAFFVTAPYVRHNREEQTETNDVNDANHVAGATNPNAKATDDAAVYYGPVSTTPPEVKGAAGDANSTTSHHGTVSAASPRSTALSSNHRGPSLTAGNCLEIHGSVKTASGQVSIHAELQEGADLSFVQATDLDVQANSFSEVELSLNVRKWFTKLPLTACLHDGDLVPTAGLVDLSKGKGRCTQNVLQSAFTKSAVVHCKD